MGTSMQAYTQYDMGGTCTHMFWDHLMSTGTITGASKNFVINHPLDEDKVLIHTCIESPQADLHYSGTTRLVAGKALIDIDVDSCPHSPMDLGTFAKLTRNPRVFLQNADGFDRVRGKVRAGILEVFCENPKSTDEVHWLVIAERRDSTFTQSKMAGNGGHLVTQGKKADWLLDESERPSRKRKDNKAK